MNDDESEMIIMTGHGDSAPKPPLTKSILSVVLVAGLILLVPLIAMQFTKEVAWTPGDFIVAGALLVGTGLMYVLAARKLDNRRSRTLVGLVLGLVFVLIWMELAVGIFGTRFAGS
jgi:hypothetical protein